MRPSFWFVQSQDCMHASPHPSACQADPLRRTTTDPPHHRTAPHWLLPPPRFRRNFFSILILAKYIQFPFFGQPTTMSFFDDAGKAVDGFVQEAGKQMGGAADEAGKNLDEFGQEGGKHIGGAVNEAGKSLDEFRQEAGKQIGDVAKETYGHAEAFGHDAAEQIGPALEEAWKHVDAFGQEAGKQIGIAAGHTKQWIEEHPGETAGIIACVVAAPLSIAAAHGALHMVGFTAAGVAAGKFPRMPTRNHMLCN